MIFIIPHFKPLKELMSKLKYFIKEQDRQKINFPMLLKT